MKFGLVLEGLLGGGVLQDVQWARQGVLLGEVTYLAEPGDGDGECWQGPTLQSFPGGRIA